MTAETVEQSEWDLSLEERLRVYESSLIREALYKTGGNRNKAAALLQVPRRTLAHKLHALGLESE
jgi:DNA-binding NtrC family response regulator